MKSKKRRKSGRGKNTKRTTRRSRVRSQVSAIRRTPFRDNLYNYSDVLAVLIIIVLAGLFIFWRVSALMDYNTVTPTAPAESSVEAVDTEDELAQALEEDSQEALSSETVTVTVGSGSSLDDVAADLYASGLIDSAEDFIESAEASGAASQLKAGTHEIPVGSSTVQIIDILTS